MTDTKIFAIIAKKLGFSPSQVQKTIGLFDEGATIPFVARYRQEVTGGLDEVQLRSLRDETDFLRLLEQRKQTILESIRKQEKLTPELEQAITDCTELNVLEDLYLPYKPKRKTKASVAIERGLEPLADLIWEQKTLKGDPLELATPFVNEEKQVPDAESALEGARDICAERISQHLEVREMLRNQLRNFGSLVAKKTTAEDEKQTYQTYYEFNCKIKYLKPYQTLAIDRGEREGILSVKIEVWEERTLEEIDNIIIADDRSVFVEDLEDAIEDAWKRLLYPSMEREIRNELTEQAGEHAIQMFAENVRNLLLQPPFATKTVLGIDPAYRTGCKVAVVDATGKYLEGTTVYPTPPHNKILEAKAIIGLLVKRHNVDLIAIGNGTGSRETELVVADLLGDVRASEPNREIGYIIVNEAGASVYSASDEAREEFPELEAAQRGNISIARRVQDPLAELVKIDPKSIGVGLYQHDVNQVKLMRSLGDVVESCVNHVGVNLNTASAALLTYVSGFSKTIAKNVVEQRNKLGKFTSRDQLQDVPGVGPFRFQQAAGFLRIPESKNPLDNTAIHPESYDAAKKLCDSLGIDLNKLPDEKDTLPLKLRNLNVSKTAESIQVGVPTLELIIENLLKPGRDPREDMPKPILRQDILSIENLHEGTKLKGTVRNVVDFGAFVDIGVKVDGLLHISVMRTDGKKVEQVMDELSVGDIVDVEVTSVDAKRQRIGLKRV
jgi:uncharacterized protein